MKDVSIIIVNYNSGDYLYRCLDSIKSYVHINYEVIVVDNKSTDNSIQKCSNFFGEVYKLINANENLGFARANNLGFKEATGKLIHFLNPDTEVRDGINDDYLIALQNCDNIFINDLQNIDETFVQSKNLIPTILNCLYKLFYPSKCKYWYTGATVIISRKNFELVGHWNEYYFMYAEDLDLFYKINLNNISINKLNSIITHIGGVSSSKTWANYEREKYKQRSLKLFYEINDLKWQYNIMSIITILYQLPKNFQYGMTLYKIWKEL